MRAAAILGLGCSERDLKPFQEKSNATWLIGLPASSGEVDAILLFGGDGTVHRHLAQLVQLRRPVLVVPKGSGNDFARALGLGRMRDSLGAWRKFESGGGNVRAIDLGFITELGVTTHRLAGETPAVRGHYFCCVGGVGLDGEISRRANALPRWLRGHGGYVFSMPAAVMQLAAFPMKILEPDPQGTDAFVTRSSGPVVVATFANTPVYGGGMKIAPKALGRRWTARYLRRQTTSTSSNSFVFFLRFILDGIRACARWNISKQPVCGLRPKNRSMFTPTANMFARLRWKLPLRGLRSR